MGQPPDGRYSYTADNAKRYGAFGIAGTTYEIGYHAVGKLLGDITGQAFLDFGSGAGRSAAFLTALGAGHVYGVDHDQNMIEAAVARNLGGVTFQHIEAAIPLPSASVDGAISLNVFLEIRTVAEMSRVCREIARVLRPGRPFVMMSSSPAAYGHSFRSYRYPDPQPLRSGDLTPVVIITPDGEFRIEDTFWTEADYVTALRQGGLTVATIDYPRPDDPGAWSTEEASVPPFIIIKAVAGAAGSR